MKNIVSLCIAIFLMITSSLALAGAHYIQIKSGDYTIDTTRQTVLGHALDISAKNASSLAVEYQYKFENNISIGGEFMQAKHRYTDLTSGTQGSIYTDMFLFEAKYNLEMTQWLYSFIGISAGFATADFNGPVSGNTIGSALGYSAGLTFRFSPRVGLSFQYKQISSETEDSFGNQFDATGHSVTANVSIFF